MHIPGGWNHSNVFQIPYQFLELVENIKIYKHEILLGTLESREPSNILPKVYLGYFSLGKAAGTWRNSFNSI